MRFPVITLEALGEAQMARVPLHVALGIVAGADEEQMLRLRAMTRQSFEREGFGPGFGDATSYEFADDLGFALKLHEAWRKLRTALIEDRVKVMPSQTELIAPDVLPHELAHLKKTFELPIDEDTLRATFESASRVLSPKPNKRGPKGKDFWTQCQSAFLAHLDQHGEPTTQSDERDWQRNADAERWVAEWLTGRRLTASESTIRTHVTAWLRSFRKTKEADNSKGR